MILTRKSIKALIKAGKLKFSPDLDIFQDQPHAVDLRLGTVFYMPKTWKLTPKGREILKVDFMERSEENYEKIILTPGQFFELAPGETVIASTFERIELHAPDIMGVLYPRSSINRRGLSVDLTGIIDAYYKGHLMIPILNKTTTQVIRLYPGERFCQVVFHQLSEELSESEALRHGAQPSKYNEVSAENLNSLQDNREELSFIRLGDMEGLKNFPYMEEKNEDT